MWAIGAFVIGALAGLLSTCALLFGILWLLSRRRAAHPITPANGPIEGDPAAGVEIRREDVPRELSGAIDVARQFGAGCNGIRAELVERASAAQKAELVDTMRRHYWTIQKWIDFTRPPAEMPPWLVPMMYARDAAELVTADVAPPRSPIAHESAGAPT